LVPQAIIRISQYTYSNLTWKNIFLILVLAILITVLCLYIYTPSIVGISSGTTSGTTGINILQNPLALSAQAITASVNPIPISSNYTFSLWLYINQLPNNGVVLDILKYGNNAPLLQIQNTGNENAIIRSNNESMTMTLEEQKWNYIVLQYTQNALNIYINCFQQGSLVTNKPITYSNNDNITLGSGNVNARGIGAITTVLFYTAPLSLGEMNTIYATLGSQSVPTAF